MKRPIPKSSLLAFARECLKLQQLLSEPDDLAEIGKYLNLLRSIERSGGIAALEAALRPEPVAAVVLDSTASAPKEAARPVPAPRSHL